MFVYEIQDHPTQKGKLLAICGKPESWRCNTIEEDAFEMIGGKHWRPMGRQIVPSDQFIRGFMCKFSEERYAPQWIGYTLSKAQARDLEAILKAGFLPTYNVGSWNEVHPESRLFFRPSDHSRDFTREEALAEIGGYPRCTRTYELPLAA